MDCDCKLLQTWNFVACAPVFKQIKINRKTRKSVAEIAKLVMPFQHLIKLTALTNLHEFT